MEKVILFFFLTPISSGAMVFAQQQDYFFLDYPDGVVSYSLEVEGASIYYVTTFNNLSFNSSNRLHTSILIDTSENLNGVQIVQIRDDLTDENDYVPDAFMRYGEYFVEHVRFRNRLDGMGFSIFYIYDEKFNLLRMDTFDMKIGNVYPVQRSSLYQFIGLSVVTSSSYVLFGFNELDLSITAESLTLDHVQNISCMVYDEESSRYFISHNAGLGILGKEFNIIELIHSSIVRTVSLTHLSFYRDKVISFGTRFPPGFTLPQVTFNLYDKELVLLEHETYGDTEAYDFPFLRKSLDQTNDAIFTGAILDWDVTFTLPIEFVISKYNQDRELLWRYNYGGDAPYQMWGLNATQDGGCVAYGSRRGEDGVRYPFMLKISSDGLTTPVTDASDSAHAFTLYGNPIKGTLNLSADFPYTQRYTLLLSDVTGRVLLTEELQQGMNTYPVGHLSPGTYYYTIVSRDAGRVVESCPVVVLH